MSTDFPKTACLVVVALFSLLFSEGLSWAGRASVFVYHRFGDARYPSTNISLDDFEAHLEYLRKENVLVFTLGEVVRRLRSGIPLPESCAVLTVDDGYKTFLTGAMPLLRRYGYPATLFVSTGSVGNTGYLDWEELRELIAGGIEIGNHSDRHDYLVERKKTESEAEWLERIEGDIVAAQNLFRKNLGIEPKLFSYPFGEYTPEIVNLLRRLGFSGAVVQHSGVVGETTDPFLIPRFPMGANYGKSREFISKLRMGFLPVRVIDPPSPLLGAENPPPLVLEIAESAADLSRLSFYVNGREGASIQSVPGYPGRLKIVAQEPLTSRRTAYVLTAPARDGKGWYWFSYLWIKGGM